MRTKAPNRNEMLRTIYNDIESDISRNCLDFISTQSYLFKGQLFCIVSKTNRSENC